MHYAMFAYCSLNVEVRTYPQLNKAIVIFRTSFPSMHPSALQTSHMFS
jgi:hypothetical protein